MEAGLPVLLTRCGGMDTYVSENTGWTCEPESVDALTAELLRMLDAPADRLVAMGNQARLLVQRHFPIQNIARQNADLLQELIEVSRP
jgi:glycosyltransferase involved in cell wall biosynthesis